MKLGKINDFFSHHTYKGSSLICHEPVILLRPKDQFFKGKKTFTGEKSILNIKSFLLLLFPYACHGLDDKKSKKMNIEEQLILLFMVFAKNTLNKDRGAIKYYGLLRSSKKNANHHFPSFFIGYHDETVTLEVLNFAIHLISWIESNIDLLPEVQLRSSRQDVIPEYLRSYLSRLEVRCKQYHPDFQAKILIEGSRRLKLSFNRHSLFPAPHKSWRYGMSSKSVFYHESLIFEEGIQPSHICKSKSLTSKFLRHHGYPFPEHIVVKDENELIKAWHTYNGNIVVKPLDSGKGNGVFVLPKDEKYLKYAFHEAKKYSPAVLVEKYIEGNEYRLLVVDGKLISSIQRVPPSVTGDGLSSIKYLIETLNAKLTIDPWTRDIRVPINHNDAKVLKYLATSGYSLSTILPKGTKALLNKASNVSKGGHCVELSDVVHPSIKLMVEDIASQLSLHCIGFDFISPDPYSSWKDVKSSILEINTCPGLFLHCTSNVKTQEHIGSKVLGDKPSNIPSVLIVGSRKFNLSIYESLLSQWDEKVPSDIGIMMGNHLVIGEHKYQNLNDEWGKIEHLLENKNCSKLIFMLSIPFVINNGLPLNSFELAISEKLTAMPSNTMLLNLLEKYSKKTTVIDASNTEEFYTLKTELIEYFSQGLLTSCAICE